LQGLSCFIPGYWAFVKGRVNQLIHGVSWRITGF